MLCIVCTRDETGRESRPQKAVSVDSPSLPSQRWGREMQIDERREVLSRMSQ